MCVLDANVFTEIMEKRISNTLELYIPRPRRQRYFILYSSFNVLFCSGWPGYCTENNSKVVSRLRSKVPS